MSRRQTPRPFLFSAAASRLAAALLFMAARKICYPVVGHARKSTTSGNLRPIAHCVGQRLHGAIAPATMIRITA